MSRKIRWGAIQPLTGGMYIGTENATGTPAQWIISFPGFNTAKPNKNGELIEVGNEYNLTQWLQKRGEDIPYYTFDRKPFDTSFDVDNILIYDEYTKNIGDFDNTNSSAKVVQPDFNDMDLVIAVPVCSGLSMVTSGKQEMKDERNCNMLFITKYALNVIKPKMYVFENAPTLMGDRGDGVRQALEEIALNAGYSVLYYKTDTKLHNNCQKRPRTFIIFQKWDGDSQQTPHCFGYENVQIDFPEYMANIPEDATQQIPMQLSPLNIVLIDYAKHLFGDDWRKKTRTHLLDNVDVDGRWEDFIKFVKSSDNIEDLEKTKIEKFIRHAQHKRSLGLNYMSAAVMLVKDKTPSVQFKSMQSVLHPDADRLLTIRECLHLMGMPHDFEILGDALYNFAKIGQNVPVRTAEWIVKECVRIIEDWDKLEDRKSDSNMLYIDNIKQCIHSI